MSSKKPRKVAEPKANSSEVFQQDKGRDATKELEKLHQENLRLKKNDRNREGRIGRLEADRKNLLILNQRFRELLKKANNELLEKDFNLGFLQQKLEEEKLNSTELQRDYEVLCKEHEELRRASNDEQGRQGLIHSNAYRSVNATSPDEQAAKIEDLEARLRNSKVSLMEERCLVDSHVKREKKLLPGFMFTLLTEYEGKHILLPATVGLPYNRSVKHKQWLCDVCKKKCNWYCWTCWMHGGYQPQPPYLCAFDKTDCWTYHVHGHSFRMKEGMYKDCKEPEFQRSKLMLADRENPASFEIENGYEANVMLTKGIRQAGSALYNQKYRFVSDNSLNEMNQDRHQQVPTAVDLNTVGMGSSGSQADNHNLLERMAEEIVLYADPSMFKKKKSTLASKLCEEESGEESYSSERRVQDSGVDLEQPEATKGVSSSSMFHPTRKPRRDTGRKLVKAVGGSASSQGNGETLASEGLQSALGDNVTCSKQDSVSTTSLPVTTSASSIDGTNLTTSTPASKESQNWSAALKRVRDLVEGPVAAKRDRIEVTENTTSHTFK